MGSNNWSRQSSSRLAGKKRADCVAVKGASGLMMRQCLKRCMPNPCPSRLPRACTWPLAPLFLRRGTPWCNPHALNGTSPADPGDPCSRHTLPLLSQQHPELLNVGINQDSGGTSGLAGPPASHRDHAHYKCTGWVAVGFKGAAGQLAAES